MFRKALFLGLLLSSLIVGQNDTLGLNTGYLSFSTTNFDLKPVNASQILVSLKPSGSPFDFSPFDVLAQRAADGNYHVGDVNLRWRTSNGAEWYNASTADARAVVTALSSTNEAMLAQADLAPTIEQDAPFQITREWIDLDGDLGLLFTIINTANSTMELGTLGFPSESNNIFTNRNAASVEANCFLQDPYIGLGAGYVQVTPIDGVGQALVITGLSRTNFEAWRFLPEIRARAWHIKASRLRATTSGRLIHLLGPRTSGPT